MTPHQWITIRALLRLYPAAWRKEYGAELGDVLSQRPLTMGTIVDVLWNAGRQRLRDGDPVARIGTIAMLSVAAGVIANIVAPATAAQGFGAVLRDSSHTLPTIVVAPFATELYVLALVACGWLTHARHGGPMSQSGMAAVKLGALAGLPVMLVGILVFLGIIHLSIVGPDGTLTALADTAWADTVWACTPWAGRGWTYTFYLAHTAHASQAHAALPHVPSALAIIVAPLFRLPESWIWGVIGGLLGRDMARWRRTRRPVSLAVPPPASS